MGGDAGDVKGGWACRIGGIARDETIKTQICQCVVVGRLSRYGSFGAVVSRIVLCRSRSQG